MYHVIGADQKEYGPLSADQLRQWMVERRVDAQTKVRAEGSSDWKALAEFPELAEVLKGLPLRTVAAMPSAGPAVATPVVARTSRMAIGSLVLGILGLFSCGLTALVGLGLGIGSMVRISRSGGALRGQGLALAGTIVSGIVLLMVPIELGMLLPALSKAKTKAGGVQCMNNMKQLALGLVMYAGDHDNRLPQGTNWCEAIQPYLGGTQVFKCVNGDPTQRSHYAFNARLSGMDIRKIPSPAQTVLIFETDGGWDVSGGPEALLQKPRHNRAVGLAFVDGHAEISMPQRLPTLRWNP